MKNLRKDAQRKTFKIKDKGSEEVQENIHCLSDRCISVLSCMVDISTCSSFSFYLGNNYLYVQINF